MTLRTQVKERILAAKNPAELGKIFGELLDRIETVSSLIDQHIPSLTDDDDDEIDTLRFGRFGLHGNLNDNAELAIRTCHCGVRIDGYYEYVEHLKEVLNGSTPSD